MFIVTRIDCFSFFSINPRYFRNVQSLLNIWNCIISRISIVFLYTTVDFHVNIVPAFRHNNVKSSISQTCNEFLNFVYLQDYPMLHRNLTCATSWFHSFQPPQSQRDPPNAENRRSPWKKKSVLLIALFKKKLSA